jgi:membrane associated rhomboid family serine protease
MIKIIPRTVKYLIFANLIVYFVCLISMLMGHNLSNILGLVPYLLVTKYYVWQFVTYMFVHSGPMHIFFNLLMLWMFGTDLCKLWGESFFLKYYIICGLGAGLTVLLLSPLDKASFISPTVGASGAIFGLFLAYGLIYKKKPIYVFGVVPIEARYLVMILGTIEFLSLISEGDKTVSHIAHLGGIATGFAYLKLKDIQRNNRAKNYKKWKASLLNKQINVIYNEFDKKNDPNNHIDWN